MPQSTKMPAHALHAPPFRALQADANEAQKFNSWSRHHELWIQGNHDPADAHERFEVNWHACERLRCTCLRGSRLLLAASRRLLHILLIDNMAIAYPNAFLRQLARNAQWLKL